MIDFYFNHHTYAGPHSLQVFLPGLTLWWSYDTLVAFRVHDAEKPTVCENRWGSTTGEHLDAIDGGDKAGRLTREAFTDELTHLANDLQTGLGQH